MMTKLSFLSNLYGIHQNLNVYYGSIILETRIYLQENPTTLLLKKKNASDQSNIRMKKIPSKSQQEKSKVWKTNRTYSSVIASWFVKPKFGKGSSILGGWEAFKAGVLLEARSALFSSFSSAFLFPPFWKYSRHTLKRQRSPRETEWYFWSLQ